MLNYRVELSSQRRKKTFTLSGKNPTTGEIHTLTETMASAGAQSSVITVNTNTGAKETTLRDINVVGKNYYGTISVYGAAKKRRTKL